MTVRKAAKEPETRERILASAAEVFSSLGFAAARVDDIAEKAGVNKAMLYYHVGDKQALYTAVLVGTVEKALAALQPVVNSRKPATEKLRAILQAFVAFGGSNPVLIPIVLREIASGGTNLPDEMIAKMSSVFGLVAEVLGEGVSAGEFRKTDPLLTHVTLVGSAMFLVASRPVRVRLAKMAGISGEQHSAGELAEHIANVFIHGIEAVGASKPDSKPVPNRTKKSRSLS